LSACACVGLWSGFSLTALHHSRLPLPDGEAIGGQESGQEDTNG